MAALNKYWRRVSKKEYKKKMDIVDVVNACSVAGFPKEVVDAIWEKHRTFGEVF